MPDSKPLVCTCKDESGFSLVSYVIETAANTVVKAMVSSVAPIAPLDKAEFIKENSLFPDSASPTRAASFAAAIASSGTFLQLESHSLPSLFKNDSRRVTIQPPSPCSCVLRTAGKK
jgi:selenophosphate synthase